MITANNVVDRYDLDNYTNLYWDNYICLYKRFNMDKQKLTYEFPDPSNEKLKEMILYISEKCKNHGVFGVTKLNKILWFSDALAFKYLGKPITGTPYIRKDYGPVPKYIKEVREELVQKRDLAIQKEQFFNRIQERPIHLRRADVHLFSADQLRMVDDVIEILEDASAAEVSELSHEKVWELLEDEEPMPYEALFISGEPVNQSDIDRTKALVKEGVLK